MKKPRIDYEAIRRKCRRAIELALANSESSEEQRTAINNSFPYRSRTGAAYPIWQEERSLALRSRRLTYHYRRRDENK